MDKENKKLALTDEELSQVVGGSDPSNQVSDGNCKQTVALNFINKCKTCIGPICSGCKYSLNPNN